MNIREVHDMSKRLKKKKIGVKDFGKTIDIADVKYAKGDLCRRMNQVAIKDGNYTCRVWHEMETSAPAEKTVKIIGIYLGDVIPPAWAINYIGEIDVDTGMVGFFANKPDYADEEWQAFCDPRCNKKQTDAWITAEGFFISGVSKGTYDVFAAVNKDGDVHALTTIKKRQFDWANPGKLLVGDIIREKLKNRKWVSFVVVDDGVIGLDTVFAYYSMNENGGNDGEWLDSDMREYLNHRLIQLLPDNLVAAIEPRRFGDEEDKLWLYSEMEVFGEQPFWEVSQEKYCGTQFKYFKNERNRLALDRHGHVVRWWTRSPYNPDPEARCGFCGPSFLSVHHGDESEWENPTLKNGIRFAFYIKQ